MTATNAVLDLRTDNSPVKRQMPLHSCLTIAYSAERQLLSGLWHEYRDPFPPELSSDGEVAGCPRGEPESLDMQGPPRRAWTMNNQVGGQRVIEARSPS